MVTYNFDEIIDRKNSDAYKYGGVVREWGRDDLLPLWVADMDFATPPFVINTLKKRLEHPVLGYTLDPPELWPTIINWISTHHQWQVKREWLTYVPGIVKGLGLVVNVFTKPGDKVIIQPPVYHPFRLTPQGNGREVVMNPLKMNADGSYEMDFEQLEQVCDEHCKLLVLCNPHNPAGICWRKETLLRLAHFCKEHNILVVSDEIHCDMAIFGHKHIPFASVSDEAAQNSITFQAPTKTFNMAGVVSSYTIVPNAEIRERFFGWLSANEMSEPNMFAPIATVAAFSEGEEWRRQMLSYIEQNIIFVEDYCRKNMPQIRPVRPEASFLIWLNCRGLNLNHEQLLELFVEKAHLALNDGEMFGVGGEGFMRLNVGAPRITIKKALDQLCSAINS